MWSSFQLVHKEYYLCFINAGKFIAFTTVCSLLLLTSLNKFMSAEWHAPSLVGHDDRSAGTLIVVALVWATGSALLLFAFISYITGIV